MERAPSDGDNWGSRRTFAVSSWLFLRLLGVVFACAFASLWAQLEGLIGSDGIVPAAERIAHLGRSERADFWDMPSLAWGSASDGALHVYCGLGLLAACLLAAGFVPWPALLACWGLYLSLAGVGVPFTVYQWDALLLEAGFTALLLAPLTVWSRPGSTCDPWPVGRWLVYLLLFKLMFSSGVVKLASGDPTWHELTALTFHYETQPLPHVVGWWAHQLPAWIHKVSAAAMFVIELGVPFAIFVPGWPRRIACVLLAGLQLLIAGTGNYGFFNLLTLALCIPLLDDAAMRRLLPWRLRHWTDRPLVRQTGRPHIRQAPALALAALVGVMSSSQLVVTLFRPEPGWFRREILGAVAPLHTFNRYGLFANMTTERPEIILEGSRDGQNWKEYDFAYKPDDPHEPPHFCTPHMPRLDWQMWFAALGNIRGNRWLIRYMRDLLQGEPAAVDLLEDNPFSGRPPRFIRAVRYDYRFTDPETLEQTGRWWRRERQGLYAPVLRRRDNR